MQASVRGILTLIRGRVADRGHTSEYDSKRRVGELLSRGRQRCDECVLRWSRCEDVEVLWPEQACGLIEVSKLSDFLLGEDAVRGGLRVSPRAVGQGLSKHLQNEA